MHHAAKVAKQPAGWVHNTSNLQKQFNTAAFHARKTMTHSLAPLSHLPRVMVNGVELEASSITYA
eukprot:scaffold191680_cov22-Tisochrysis_lutea.AAC.3